MKLVIPKMKGTQKRNQQSNCLFLGIILVALILTSTSTYAGPEFHWNGFATLGLSQIDDDEILSQGNVPYSTHSESLGEESDTLFAFQGTLQFTDRFSGIVQVLSKSSDDYKPEPEWAYLSFEANENVKLRFGRLRRPLFHYSDYFDVGYAYQWARPPATTYFDFGPFYNPIDSIDLYFQKSYTEWNLSGQVYYGQDSGRGELFGERLTYEESAAYGTSINLENGQFNFRLGYHNSRFSLFLPRLEEAESALNQLGFTELAAPLSVEKKLISFTSLGAIYTMDKWTFGGEITRMTPEDTILPTIDTWYISAGRSFGKFSLHYSYGQQKAVNTSDPVTPILQTASDIANSPDPNTGLAVGTLNVVGSGLQSTLDSNESDRTTNILGLRYEILDSAALKLEYEHVENNFTNSSGNIFSINLNVLF